MEPIQIFENDITDCINLNSSLLRQDKSLTKVNKETILIEANRIIKTTNCFCKILHEEKTKATQRDKSDNIDIKNMIKDSIKAALSQHIKSIPATSSSSGVTVRMSSRPARPRSRAESGTTSASTKERVAGSRGSGSGTARGLSEHGVRCADGRDLEVPTKLELGPTKNSAMAAFMTKARGVNARSVVLR